MYNIFNHKSHEVYYLLFHIRFYYYYTGTFILQYSKTDISVVGTS